MISNLRFIIVITLYFILAGGLANAQGFEWADGDNERLSEIVASGTYGKITSVWIEQNGKIIFQDYFHGADANTLHNMRSAGKTITGMLVGTAIADGLIKNTEAKAASFFSELRPFQNNDPRKEAISLKDLLTMSGPLECDDWNSFSRGNEERMYLVEDWSSFFWDLPIKNRPSWEIPDSDNGFGRLFTYCTAGAQLLGEIVERVTGKTAAEYAAMRLFGPLDINNPKWNRASSGKLHLGGGLELTTADWASTGRLYVNHGRMGKKQVVSESWVDQSLMDYVQIDDDTNYGYLWWRPKYDVAGNIYTGNSMSGSGGNRVYALPEFGVVVVITKSDFRDREAHVKSDQFFSEEIVARLRK